MKGLHTTVMSFLRSQPNPKEPVGTVIDVNSSLAGYPVVGNSAYGSAKLAAHRYVEYVALGK